MDNSTIDWIIANLGFPVLAANTGKLIREMKDLASLSKLVTQALNSDRDPQGLLGLSKELAELNRKVNLPMDPTMDLASIIDQLGVIAGWPYQEGYRRDVFIKLHAPAGRVQSAIVTRMSIVRKLVIEDKDEPKTPIFELPQSSRGKSGLDKLFVEDKDPSALLEREVDDIRTALEKVRKAIGVHGRWSPMSAVARGWTLRMTYNGLRFVVSIEVPFVRNKKTDKQEVWTRSQKKFKHRIMVPFLQFDSDTLEPERLISHIKGSATPAKDEPKTPIFELPQSSRGKSGLDKLFVDKLRELSDTLNKMRALHLSKEVGQLLPTNTGTIELKLKRMIEAEVIGRAKYKAFRARVRAGENFTAKDVDDVMMAIVAAESRLYTTEKMIKRVKQLAQKSAPSNVIPPRKEPTAPERDKEQIEKDARLPKILLASIAATALTWPDITSVTRVNTRNFSSGAKGHSVTLTRTDNNFYTVGITYMPQKHQYASQIVFFEESGESSRTLQFSEDHKNISSFISLATMVMRRDIDSRRVLPFSKKETSTTLMKTEAPKIKSSGLSTAQKAGLVALAIAVTTLGLYGMKKLLAWMHKKNFESVEEVKTAYKEVRKHKKLTRKAKKHLIVAVKKLNGPQLMNLRKVADRLKAKK